MKSKKKKITLFTFIQLIIGLSLFFEKIMNFGDVKMSLNYLYQTMHYIKAVATQPDPVCLF